MKGIKIFKSTNIFLVLFILLAGFAAVSCNNLTLQNQSQKPVLTITLEEQFRTVSPELSLDQLSNFQLTGKKSGEETVVTLGNASGYATAAALTNAVITLPDDAAGNSWELTLTAQCHTGGVNKTYTSTVTKTINAGQNAVKFTYTFKSDYNDGNGSFSVTLDWTEKTENSGKVNKATAVFENMDGSSVSSSITGNITIGNINNNTVTISGNNIPAGTYRLKMYLNKDEAHIAYWQEVVKVAGGFSSSATRTIQDFLVPYTITYHLNNGTNEVETLSASIATDLLVPQRAGYELINWYTDTACKHVFDIKTLCSDIDLYAKWFDANDINMATKNTIVTRIANASSTDPSEPFVIQAFGPFTDTDFSAAADALDSRHNDNVYIALDFSEVQTDIKNFEYFRSCSRLAGIAIPDSVEVKGSSFDCATNLRYIDVSVNNQNYSSKDGVLCDKGETKIVAFPCGKVCTDNSYKTPDCITSIGQEAFCGTLKINTIIISENVTVLSIYSFKNTSNITVSFDDKTHIWDDKENGYYYGLYGDIEKQVKKILESNSNTLSRGFNKQNKVFSDLLTEAQLSPVTVVPGAGDNEDNFDINTTGYNTLTIQTPGSGTPSAEKWYSFATTPGHTYNLYLCCDVTVSDFSNIPESTVLWGSLQFNVYSGDGTCCIDRLGINGDSYDSFTAEAEQDIAYIRIAVGGYYGASKMVYLLIRDAASVP